ncbi:hypothetical protein BH23PLA1_BH23PLA1_06950 [soil metagenome]
MDPRWEPRRRALLTLLTLLTKDYCPWMGRGLWRWLRGPTSALLSAFLVALACGFLLHPQGYVLAAGLALVLALGIVWPWLGLLGLSGKLSWERVRAREGEPVPARLRLRNRAPWGSWGLAVGGLSESAEVRSAAGEALPGAGPSVAVDHVGAWRTREISWSFVPGCRGVYPIGHPRIVSGFPFGLRESSCRLILERSLLVWPLTFAVGPLPDVAGGRQAEGSAPRDRVGTTGDLLGVRPYRRGDSLRRVHWPQTARTGELIVCELQSQAVPLVQVVLDNDPTTHAGTGSSSSLEWSIRIAASYLEDWIGQGAAMELIVSGVRVELAAGSLAARRARALDVLARLTTENALPINEVLDLPPCRRFQGGLRLVVGTDRALDRLSARVVRGGVVERFVTLRASAFADEEAEGSSIGPRETGTGTGVVRPWIWVDDPGRVVQQLRKGGRGSVNFS